MSSLAGRTLDASYKELLKISPATPNTGIDGTLRTVEDGFDNDSALQISSAGIKSTGTLLVDGNTALSGTLAVTQGATLSSTLLVNGATTLSSTLGVTGTTTVSDLTASGYAQFNSTGAFKIPSGTTVQRPSPAAGMLRFNTTSSEFEGYNGAAWGGIGGSGGGGSAGTSMYVRETFTATGGQTTFAVTGGYTPDKIDVFQNGIKLVNGASNDVNVSSGVNVVLSTGAAAGDVIDVVGLTSGNFAGPATAKRQTFTATAGQTTFTVTGGYTPGQLDVFQNGTKLLYGVDVDVSNGTSVILTTGANLNDTVEVVGFTAADTVSGTLKFQAGTAAAPSITTFGDTNTGIFFPAADTIAFSDGGTEAMRIDSSGNVGIGTATTDDAGLTITKSVTRDNGWDAKLALQSTGSDDYPTLLFSGCSSTSRYGGIVQTASQSGNDAQQITASIEFINTSPTQGAIRVYTNNNVGTTIPSERLRIDTNGNVGIGTTSPNQKLVVVGAASDTETIRVITGSSSGTIQKTGIGFSFSSTATNPSALIHAEEFDAIDARASLVFSTNNTNSDTAPVERMRIVNDGAVLMAKSTNSLTVIGASFGTSGECNFSLAGTTNSSSSLGVYSTGAAAYRFYVGLAGTVFATNTTISAISDARLKENIRDLDVGIDSIMALKPRIFDWKTGKGQDKKNVRGFIAQELEQIFPDLIDEWKDPTPEGEEPYKSVRQDLIPVIVKALQDLKNENDSLKSRITALEAA